MRVPDVDKHLDSYTCRKGASRRCNEQKQDRQAKAEEVKFFIDGIELEKVREFKYLGRYLSYDNNDSYCIDYNIKKARQQWNCIARLLKREGASASIMAKFYITIVQAVLLFGADSWTVTRRNLNKLQSFHRRALRFMCGDHIRKEGDETWLYPDHEKLLQKCGLCSIEVYLERRRNTLWRFLEPNRRELLNKTRNCGRHCKDANKVLWWEQSYYDTLL